MAYIDFQAQGAAAMTTQTYRTAPTSDPVPCSGDRLTALEWSVVAIARKDREASLRRPGRLSTVLRALLKRPNPMLANTRLEALRRMAVLAWRYGYTVPSDEVRSFLDAGYSSAQYETMVDFISAERVVQPRARPA